MSGRGFVDFSVIFRKTISPDGRRTYTQQCLLNQASPVKNNRRMKSIYKTISHYFLALFYYFKIFFMFFVMHKIDFTYAPGRFNLYVYIFYLFIYFSFFYLFSLPFSKVLFLGPRHLKIVAATTWVEKLYP
jgi:hypothetical protein